MTSTSLASRAIRPLFVCLCALVGSFAPGASAQKFTTFQVPVGGAPYPVGINASGEIAGVYFSKSGSGGFLRLGSGKIETFNAPPGKQELGGTGSIRALNAAGTIVGEYYQPAPYRYTITRAFVRKPSGSIFTIDVPGSCLNYLYCEGTVAIDINQSGTIVGNYQDSGHRQKGFIYSPQGKITDFGVAAASSRPSEGTLPAKINNLGAITGQYTSQTNGSVLGFIRSPQGHFTTFAVTGASKAEGQGTIPTSMNDDGVVTGWFTNSNQEVMGFVRSATGAISPFAGPASESGLGTFPTAINLAGEVVGYYYDNLYVMHGFMRTASGKVTKIDVPGATHVSYSYEGTAAVGINDAGVITGYYTRPDLSQYGFVLTP